MRVEELRASGLQFKLWRSLALRCLQGQISLFCGSMASLQTAVMLLLDGSEDSLALDSLLVTAISGARKLGLHKLGDVKLEITKSSDLFDYGPTALAPPHVRIEIGIRIWWALVMRDWSRGQSLGYYTIQPSQFNTRLPLHINDEDLDQKVSISGHQIAERPRSEFTMFSYTIYSLEISLLVRELIDLRQTFGKITNSHARSLQQLVKKYEVFVTGLPSHFRIGNSDCLTATGPLAAVPVQQ